MLALSLGFGASPHFKNFLPLMALQATSGIPGRRSHLSQRQIRKNRRRAHAAGSRNAFA